MGGAGRVFVGTTDQVVQVIRGSYEFARARSADDSVEFSKRMWSRWFSIQPCGRSARPGNSESNAEQAAAHRDQDRFGEELTGDLESGARTPGLLG
jgi:hypothetical protein